MCGRTRDAVTALFAAAQKGDVNSLGILLAAKAADVNAKDESSNNGFTALFWAARQGHAEAVKVLLEAKANANEKDRYNGTALIWAAGNGHTEVVKLLLKAGAEVNEKAGDGVTALISAARSGHTEVVRLLLSAKADAEARDLDGRTALTAALVGGHAEVVKALAATQGDKEMEATTSESLVLAGGRAEYGLLFTQAAKNSNFATQARAAWRRHADRINVKLLLECLDAEKDRQKLEAIVDAVEIAAKTMSLKLLFELFNAEKDRWKAEKIAVMLEERIKDRYPSEDQQADRHCGEQKADQEVIAALEQSLPILPVWDQAVAKVAFLYHVSRPLSREMRLWRLRTAELRAALALVLPSWKTRLTAERSRQFRCYSTHLRKGVLVVDIHSSFAVGERSGGAAGMFSSVFVFNCGEYSLISASAVSFDSPWQTAAPHAERVY